MVSLLPELVTAGGLVPRLASGETVQAPGTPLGRELRDPLAGRKLLEIAITRGNCSEKTNAWKWLSKITHA
jgi:hypothetical protein